MICFTFLKGVLPIFCWTGHGSEVKRTNCNQVSELQNETKNEKRHIWQIIALDRTQDLQREEMYCRNRSIAGREVGICQF